MTLTPLPLPLPLSPPRTHMWLFLPQSERRAVSQLQSAMRALESNAERRDDVIRALPTQGTCAATSQRRRAPPWHGGVAAPSSAVSPAPVLIPVWRAGSGACAKLQSLSRPHQRPITWKSNRSQFPRRLSVCLACAEELEAVSQRASDVAAATGREAGRVAAAAAASEASSARAQSTAAEQAAAAARADAAAASADARSAREAVAAAEAAAEARASAVAAQAAAEAERGAAVTREMRDAIGRIVAMEAALTGKADARRVEAAIDEAYSSAAPRAEVDAALRRKASRERVRAALEEAEARSRQRDEDVAAETRVRRSTKGGMAVAGPGWSFAGFSQLTCWTAAVSALSRAVRRADTGPPPESPRNHPVALLRTYI